MSLTPVLGRTRTSCWHLLPALGLGLGRTLRQHSTAAAAPNFRHHRDSSDKGEEGSRSGGDQSHEGQGPGPSTGSTILKEEVDKFERMAGSWWSQSGEFKALHSMNQLRVPFIRDGFLNSGQIAIAGSNVEFPLEGLTLLDIGCGGGILSLPLGRLGAQVTGLDVGKENIEMANAELQRSVPVPQGSGNSLADRVCFIHSSLEDFLDTQSNVEFDGVIISEVLEHVADPRQFLQLASEALRPGGSLFITTINRTYLSWLGAIVAAEYVLRLLPIGTHRWKAFVAPEEIQIALHRNGMSTRLIHGMSYNIWTNSWSWTQCTDVNYALHAVKPK